MTSAIASPYYIGIRQSEGDIVGHTDSEHRRVRAFRALLRLYPPEYRQRYGREMEGFFLEEHRVAGGGPRFWIRLVADHVEALLQFRAERLAGAYQEHPPPARGDRDRPAESGRRDEARALLEKARNR